MSWINNQVSEREVEKLENDCFELEAKRIDCFGIFPKFALNDKNRVFVVQAEPISGFWGGIMGWLFPWKEKNPKVIEMPECEDGGTQFLRLYSLRDQLGSKIRGCIIPMKRTDEFREVLCRNNGQVHYEFTFIATVQANIDPVKLFNFLKTHDNVRRLKSALEECMLNKMEEEFSNREGDPDFTLKLEKESFDIDVLQEAGYMIVSCYIRYLNVK